MVRNNFNGFYFKKEKWANNKEIYENISSDSKRPKTQREEAKKQLELYQMFPPGRNLQRLVAHKIKIFKIMNPQNVSTKKFVYSIAGLEEIICFDLGVELMREEGMKLYEWIPKKKDMIHYLDEKRKIIGTEYHARLKEESSLKQLEKFFDVSIDHNNDSYNLKIKKKSLLSPLKEIHIESYVRLINDQHDTIIDNEKIIARGGHRIIQKKNRFYETTTRLSYELRFSKT